MNELPAVVASGVSAVSFSERAAAGGGDCGLPVGGLAAGDVSAVGEVAAGDGL
jgi:hypothetical protein